MNDVIDYAARHIAAGSIAVVEPVVEEARSPVTAVTQQSQSEANRANAIAYAYEWSESGNAKRNPAYPDFGADDCTNFVSQAMEVGGFRKVGSGDGCTHGTGLI